MGFIALIPLEQHKNISLGVHQATMDMNPANTDGAYEAAYATKPWVIEIATKAVDLIERIRPFSKDDVILDYGSGPGLTVKKIFEATSQRHKDVPIANTKSSDTSSNSVDALLIDSNPLMIKEANKVKWKEGYNKTVLSFAESAFCPKLDGDTILTRSFTKILDIPAKAIDICILSLVTEFLTNDEVEALTLKLLPELSNGGVIALLEWAEHFSYPEEFRSSIHHMRGWPKEKLLKLASRLCREFENPDRVMEEEKDSDKDLFPSKPKFRVEASLGTFVVAKARTQDFPSGDSINYLIIRKCNS